MKNDWPPIHYKRKILEADDPAYEGSFAVDFVAKQSPDSDDSLPARTTYFSDNEFEKMGSLDDRLMLVALYGLAGGSHDAAEIDGAAKPDAVGSRFNPMRRRWHL